MNRNTLAVTAVLIITISTTGFSQTTSKGERSAAIHNAGVDEYKAGALNTALEMYMRAVEIEPSAETFNNIGVTLGDLGRFAEAIEYLKKGVRLFPASSHLYRNLGIAYYRSGELSEAVKYFKEAIRLQPEYLIARTDLGMALVNLNRPKEAIPILQKAVSLAPDDAIAQHTLGFALFAVERYQEGRDALQRSVELSPDLADARFLLALACAKTGDRNIALQHYAYLKSRDRMLADRLYYLLNRHKIITAKR